MQIEQVASKAARLTASEQYQKKHIRTGGWTFATRLDFVDSDAFRSGCSAETLQPTFIK